MRIKSILSKYVESGKTLENISIVGTDNDSQKDLMIELTKFNNVIDVAYEELAPHKICAYIYDLANAFNRFYHETKILAEENVERQQSYIALLKLTRDVLNTCIDLLGFKAPDRM